MHTFLPLAVQLLEPLMKFLDMLMQPLYWAISAVMIGWHHLFSLFLDPDAGLTWVLAIAGLIVVVRLAMVPLFIKQMRSTRNMSVIQPKLQELQKKYASDREKLGQETMKLYQEEGVNPMASCLPLLIQMPIMIALFTVMNGAARGQALGMFKQRLDLMHSLRNAKFLGAKLSESFLPMTHGFGGTQMLTAVLIVGMVATMFMIQWQMMQRNMTPEALTGPFAQQQKIMLYVFPLSYLFFGLNIPVGVLIYWFLGNCWTWAQQSLFIRYAPAPGTPAYVDWEERMRGKGVDPREIERQQREKRSQKKSRMMSAMAEAGEQQRVARQDLSRKGRGSTAAKAPAETTDRSSSAADSGSQDGRVVVRQQPRKQTRSVRRNK